MMKRKDWIYYLAVTMPVVLLDQVTKAAVGKSIELYGSVKVIPGFFNLTRIHNRGAVFGAFSRSDTSVAFWILTAATVVTLGVVVYLFSKTSPSEKLVRISLALIIGGALGNLADRFFRGYVLDFLDVYIGQSHWPFFNVADSAISIGVCLVLISYLRRKPSCSPSSSK